MSPETEKLAHWQASCMGSETILINSKRRMRIGGYEPLSDENMEECFQMALKWRNENGCEDNPEKKRRNVCGS